MSDAFSGREQQDVLRVDLVDGSTLTGSYLAQAGMSFLHVKVPGTLSGKVEGPFVAEDVLRVEVLKSREEVFEERYDRQRGDPVPGSFPRTREGYRSRLERLADVAARTDDVRRRWQVERQFEDVADEIELAKTKRRWVLAEARWRLHSNEEMDKLAASGGDMTSAEKFQRPRGQDFDPDPRLRRARVPVADRVRLDPRSTLNMKKALNAAGFSARVSVLSEMRDDTVDLLVDFPGGKFEGRYGVSGVRNASGSMDWRIVWEGGSSEAGLKRLRRSRSSEAYRRLTEVVRLGLDASRPEPAVEPEPHEECSSVTP